ncbi:MAG: hypothetical protein D6740_03830 [Alphaproteobacteria bacterium]|nr:MAG: hypothetical protein D6740_03830 [Alphaproteobacteria bacterium]
MAMAGALALVATSLIPVATALPAPSTGAGPRTGLAADSAYTLRDIAVDISATNAADARRQALEMARRTAYRRLIHRLVLAADRHRLPPAEAVSLPSLIEGIDILNEQYSSRRYLARLAVHFRPAAMRALFARFAVRYSETPARPRPFLLLWRQGREGALVPVPGERAADLLLRADPANRLVPVELMPDDLARRRLRLRLDAALRAGSAGRSREPDPGWALMAALDEGGMGPVVVAVVTATSSLGPRPGQVRLDLVSHGEPAVVFARETTIAPDLPFAEAAEDAAAGLLARGLDVLDAVWRQATVVRPGAVETLLLRVPSRTLAEFLQTERTLQALAILRSLETVTLAIPESTLRLEIEGNVELLALALGERGYRLHETADGHYVLRARGQKAGKPASEEARQP